jgi:hypothetical protein
VAIHVNRQFHINFLREFSGPAEFVPVCNATREGPGTRISGWGSESCSISWMLTLSRRRRMPSCIRFNGRFTVHLSAWPQYVCSVKQSARTIGPSMARITSSAEMRFGSRASRYPPLVPYSDSKKPHLPSFCRSLDRIGRGIPQSSDTSLALTGSRFSPRRSAKCLRAIRL